MNIKIAISYNTFARSGRAAMPTSVGPDPTALLVDPVALFQARTKPIWDRCSTRWLQIAFLSGETMATPQYL